MSNVAQAKPRVGYIGDIVPAELIEAYGLEPVRLTGAGTDSTPLVDSLIVPNRGTRETDVMVDAVTECVLNGTFGRLDYLVIPHISRALQSMLVDLRMAEDAGYSVPERHYLDRSYLPDAASTAYNRQQFDKFVAKLGSWGRVPSEPELRRVLESRDALDAHLSDLAARRVQMEGAISGVDAVSMIHEALSGEPSRGIEILSTQDELAAAARVAEKPQVFLGGRMFDSPVWHEVVEAAGGRVVAEDAQWCPPFASRAATGGAENMMDALREDFALSVADALVSPMHIHIDRTLHRLHESQAKLAIFIVAPGDYRMWETPTVRSRAESMGVRVLHLKNQPYVPFDRESVSAMITQFIKEGM